MEENEQKKIDPKKLINTTSLPASNYITNENCIHQGNTNIYAHYHRV